MTGAIDRGVECGQSLGERYCRAALARPRAGQYAPVARWIVVDDASLLVSRGECHRSHLFVRIVH